MDAPRTVTGEDVVELHVHGSPVVARETLRALLHAGARAAAPGEFTRRAFLNGKLDLSAAEAVADVIDAESRAAARAAHANLAGALRAAVDDARAALSAVLEELAGAIDYPDEVPEPPRSRVHAIVAEVDARLDALVRDWERGRFVREGVALAIVGPPNAGKSSLLNALLGEAPAIVAGAVAVGVVDGSRALDADARDVLRATRGRERVVLFNKRDLGTAGFDARDGAEKDAVSGSAFDPATLDAVRRAIAAVGWHGEAVDLARPHLASARQADAVARAREALAHARATLAAAAPMDLVAPELLVTVAALGEITGAAATEAVLDGVFARFCIGK